jgi:hypothetical protein
MDRIPRWNRPRLFTSLAAALMLLATSQILEARTKQTTERVSAGPQRLISISENGPIVTLRLNDGSTVDVARSNVKIKDDTLSRTAHQPRNKREPMSLTQLSQLNAAPAVVTLSYKHGEVKKAKVRVFASEAALNTFFAQRADRAAAAARAAEKKEQHR